MLKERPLTVGTNDPDIQPPGVDLSFEFGAVEPLKQQNSARRGNELEQIEYTLGERLRGSG